ncbi:hyaluronan synthase HasA [Phytohabitans houttuyneae]|uniref:Hyaluronan synthase n=1 Tax=Phytohabitans houttuyneae TaxID=1076126 RepID=A0A6V8KC38_9ACTN|nr:hyaluronan synthase [Phytohabitans houttuyneae]
MWAAHHVVALIGAVNGAGHRFTYVYAAMFGLLVWQLGVAYLERPAKVGVHDRLKLDQLNVVAIVPAFHEDPAALKACLVSMVGQTRKPNIIYVVDDGSTAVDYTPVKAWFLQAAPLAGITAAWFRQDNAGKRHAQGAVVDSTPGADVYWTVDSDTVSDPHALEELLKPLADERVQSVAGIVMAANVRRSFLTRFTDLWFVAGQLTDRSSLSVFGSVWVNSGPIAVYRAAVVRDSLEAYLSETFFGRRVPFSDDSMLTLFAMLRGRTVQQPTAYAFSLMPETTGHFARMFLRWMRGSFIRSWWRLRYLPLTSFAYWAHLLRWAQTVVAAVVFFAVAVFAPITDPDVSVVPWLVAVPLIIGYAQTLRYMTVRRSDQSLAYQWATWALTPVAVVWALVVLRAIRWYGVATCWRTGWGTRQTVEVAMAGAR